MKLGSKMLLQGAIEDASQKDNMDEFLVFLANELQDVAFFKLRPAPGKICASAIRWRAVIMDAGAIVAIANSLWQVCDRFDKPNHESNPSSNAAVFA